MKAGIALAAVGSMLILAGWIMDSGPLPGSDAEVVVRVARQVKAFAGDTYAIFGVVLGALGCWKMFRVPLDRE